MTNQTQESKSPLQEGLRVGSRASIWRVAANARVLLLGVAFVTVQILAQMSIPAFLLVPLLLLMAGGGFCIAVIQLLRAASRLVDVLRSRPGADLDAVAAVSRRQLRDVLPALAWWRVVNLIAVVVGGSFFVTAFIEAFPTFAVSIDPEARATALLQAGIFASLFAAFLDSGYGLRWWVRTELTAGRLIVVTYVLVAVIAGMMLVHPVSLRPGSSISFVDALFMAVSALTVTGLAPVVPAEVFGVTGMAVLLVLIQTGGIGIVMLTAGLAIITRNRLSIRQSQVGAETFALPNVGSFTRFFFYVIGLTLTLELIGAGLLWTLLPGDIPNRFGHALFHSVSAFCNAGISTFPQSLEIPGLGFFKLVVCLLIVVGGLGFPVVIECISRVIPSWWQGPRETERDDERSRRWAPIHAFSRLSDNSLLILSVTVGLLVAGFVGIFLGNVFGRASASGVIGELGDALFFAVSARTAGFNISPVAQLATGAQIVILGLMIVGGGPVSTAGGIKTSTFGVLLVTAVSVLRGFKWVQFRRREIPAFVVQKAVSVVVMYVCFILLAFGALLAVEDHPAWSLLFEAVSALSTNGLSLGVTGELTSAGKFIVILLMLVGRIGLIAAIYAGIGRVREQRYRLAAGRFDVG